MLKATNFIIKKLLLIKLNSANYYSVFIVIFVLRTFKKNILLIFIALFIPSDTVLATKIDSESIGKINEVYNIIKDKYPLPIHDDKILEGVLDGMLQSLDPYSAYYSPENYQFFKTESKGKYGGIGIEYEKFGKNYKIIRVIKGDIAGIVGIKTGDVITQVNNIAANTLDLAKITNMIRGPVGQKVKLTIIRDGKESLSFNITRQEIKNDLLIFNKIDNVAIFKITGFNQQTYDQLLFGIKKIVLPDKNIAGIILDLRDNPGGLLDAAIDVSNLFLQDYMKIISVKTKDNYILEEYVANDLPDVVRGLPIVVVVNGESASAAEVLAAALRDNKRAVLVGEKTFGKAAVQAFVELNTIPGAAVKITIGSYYTPRDNKIDQVGINPDIEIKNPHNFKAENDEIYSINDMQIKKAIYLILNPEHYGKLLKPNIVKVSPIRDL